MKNFTIENGTNDITVHASAADAEAIANSERFRSEDQLATLAANWPTARLVEIWNSLPGRTPVKKFKDRTTAVSRIWKAIQSLGMAEQEQEEKIARHNVAMRHAEATEQVADDADEPTAEETAALDTPAALETPDIAPETAPAKKGAARVKKAATAKAATDGPREGSKTSQVIAMLKRKGGTTLEEIMTKMGWQVHTTRAMLSAGGSLTKKHGLTITSEKIGEKRIYSLK